MTATTMRCNDTKLKESIKGLIKEVKSVSRRPPKIPVDKPMKPHLSSSHGHYNPFLSESVVCIHEKRSIVFTLSKRKKHPVTRQTAYNFFKAAEYGSSTFYACPYSPSLKFHVTNFLMPVLMKKIKEQLLDAYNG